MLRKYDLLIVIALAALQVALVLLGVEGIARVASGFLFVALLPGYSLLAAFYKPYRRDFNVMEQVALAVPTSLALSAILGLIFNLLSWVTQPEQHVIWQGILTCLPASVALVRNDISLNVDARFPAILVGVVTVALALGLVAQASAPRPDDEVVSLYLLDSQGQAANYPVSAPPDAPAQLRVGVSYRGASAQQFRLVSPNGTEAALTLQPGETWEQAVEVPVAQTGPQKLTWLLFKQDAATAERMVHIWVQDDAN